MKLNPLESSHLVVMVRESATDPQYWHKIGLTHHDIQAVQRLIKLKLAFAVDGEEHRVLPTSKGKLYTRDAKNIFSKAQVALLHKRIKKGDYWVPKVGELIYMDTSISIGHGYDDVEGGLAQISKVKRSMSGGDPNCIFIEVAQHEGGGNWQQFLFSDQAKLMKRFGTRVAYPDPDFGNYTENG